MQSTSFFVVFEKCTTWNKSTAFPWSKFCSHFKLKLIGLSISNAHLKSKTTSATEARVEAQQKDDTNIWDYRWWDKRREPTAHNVLVVPRRQIQDGGNPAMSKRLAIEWRNDIRDTNKWLILFTWPIFLNLKYWITPSLFLLSDWILMRTRTDCRNYFPHSGDNCP